MLPLDVTFVLEALFGICTQGAPFWTTSMLFALSRGKWICVSSAGPMPSHPLYGPMNLCFAGVDLLRGQIVKTSQMIVILEPRQS